MKTSMVCCIAPKYHYVVPLKEILRTLRVTQQNFYGTDHGLNYISNNFGTEDHNNLLFALLCDTSRVNAHVICDTAYYENYAKYVKRNKRPLTAPDNNFIEVHGRW